MAVVKSAPLKKENNTSDTSSEKSANTSPKVGGTTNNKSGRSVTSPASRIANVGTDTDTSSKTNSSMRTLGNDTATTSSKSADKNTSKVRHSRNIDTTGMDDADKYILATSEADNLLNDMDSNKSEIASMLNKSESDVDKMSTEDIQKGVIDSIFENDLQSEQTGREVRGENWFTDAVGGAKNAINSFNTAIGSGLDAASDAVIGGLVGLVAGDDAAQGYRDAVTGEDLAFIPDIAEDVAISLIPGAGIPLVVGKNAIQNSDEIVSGITGRDPVTQQAVDNQLLNAFLGFGGTALAALPGAGKAVNVIRGARKAGKAAQKATEAMEDMGDLAKKTPTYAIESDPLLGATSVQSPSQFIKTMESKQPDIDISENIIPNLKSITDPLASASAKETPQELIKAGTRATADTRTPLKMVEEEPIATPITTDEALDSIIADVDRTASGDGQIKQIQKMLNDISTEGGASEETAESIYNAMAAADQANSLSAISSLNPNVSRFAERGVGGSLLNNAREALTPKQVRAMRTRTIDRHGNILGDTTEKDILKSTGLTDKEIEKLSQDEIDRALMRAGRQQFKNAMRGTDITGAPAINETQQAALNLGNERLGQLSKEATQYGGGKNGLMMRINKGRGKFSKAYDAAQKDSERLQKLLGQEKLTDAETDEVARLLGNAAALPKESQAAVQGMSPGLMKRMAGYAGRMGMNNAVSVLSGAAAENEDPVTYLEDLASAATEGDFSRVIQPMLSTFIPTGKKLGTSPTGIPGAIKPSSVNSAYQISSMNTQAPINSSENTQRGRTLTTDDYLDYLQTTLQDLPEEA